MSQGKLVFAQFMQHLPLNTFRRSVARYRAERKEAVYALDNVHQLLRRQDVEQRPATQLQSAASKSPDRFLHSPIPDNIVQRLILQW